MAGHGLRGFGDIHAVGDSKLDPRRIRDHLVLQSEHRAVAASAPVHLQLVATEAETTHLEVIAEPQDGRRRSLEEQVLECLAEGEALSRAKRRESLAVENERLGEVLESRKCAERLCRTLAGWQRVYRAADEGRSRSPIEKKGTERS